MPAAGGSGKEICEVLFRFRGKNLKEAAAAANQDTAYAVQGALAQMPHFDTNANAVSLTGALNEPDEFTFQFEVTARLKRPIRF